MCTAGVLLAPVLPGCRPTYYTRGTLEADGISVLRSEFFYEKKHELQARQYIIVENERLEYPIFLYRFPDDKYAALLMKCTHQGAALNASGDHLYCPSHGSEFTNKGVVVQGPAESNLREFNVSADDKRIFIDLRS